MSSFLHFIVDAGLVGWCILFTGFCGLALLAERFQTLYVKYSINTKEFTQKINQLVLAGKIEEAIVLCGQFETKPLAKAFKIILEKADREDDALFQAQDIALSEVGPLYAKRVHYLSMLANVATLLGLLGTIHGLILSFQAVAQADPAQKQTLLAQGISVSMYTTALGLAVAIPVMVFYSFIVSKQNHSTELLVEKTSKLVELIISTHSPSLHRSVIFPDNVGSDAVSSLTAAKPPGTNIRAS